MKPFESTRSAAALISSASIALMAMTSSGPRTYDGEGEAADGREAAAAAAVGSASGACARASALVPRTAAAIQASIPPANPTRLRQFIAMSAPGVSP